MGQDKSWQSLFLSLVYLLVWLSFTLEHLWFGKNMKMSIKMNILIKMSERLHI